MVAIDLMLEIYKLNYFPLLKKVIKIYDERSS